ncbi:unnamed protein product [Soboliphyme baturini]|uniref:Ras-associating domain-containing protein n=1 Tax=Soboliphyme baturini TaxID=241478 RepID=A0A183IQX3_9BILA|nr:unnamed protein product [Soboliphyme baturini]
MFDIVNQIENCPPYLLSSQRQALAFTDVIQLCSGFSEKGMHMTFYLFNDCLEVAKRRRSWSDHSSSAKRQHLKVRKHIELLFLSNIRRVIVLKGSADPPDLFCLAIRNNMGDFYYAYQFLEPCSSDEKKNFLKSLNEQIVFISGRANYGIQEYDIDSEGTGGDYELKKALRKAVKYSKFGRQRLSRGWPSSASPDSGFHLQRAVSQMTLSLSGTLRRMSKSNLRLPVTDTVDERPVSFQDSFQNSL